MGFVSLAQDPRAGADSALTLAWLARRAGHMERTRRHVSPPSLGLALAWEVSPRRFAQDVCGLTLDDGQIAVLVDPAYRRTLGNQARQTGKSTGAAVCAAHLALFQPGARILCVAPSQRQSKLLLRTIRAVLRASRCVPTFAIDNVFELVLPNESEIVGLPASDETIRGYARPDLIIADEASRIPDPIYEAVTAMQATNAETGRFLAISTPWGQRGWWWRAWENGGADWARIERPATMCARISAAFLARERRAMGDLAFRAEYLCEFTNIDNAIFPESMIRRASAAVTDITPLYAETSPAAAAPRSPLDRIAPLYGPRNPAPAAMA